MATPSASYFPWLRFKLAVGAWAQAALGLTDADDGVMWADHGDQRPPLPYLSLQVAGGPNRRGMDSELWPRLYPSKMLVQVLPSALDAVLAPIPYANFNLFVNGELFSYVAQPADDVEAVRDAVLADVQASVQLGATAVAVDDDSIELTADRPGSLAVVAALGCTATTTEQQLVRLTTGAREVRVRATAYGAPEPLAGEPAAVSVAEWIELLTEGTTDEAAVLALRRKGWVITRMDVLQQRLSAPSGGTWEPRAAADLLFACDVRRGKLVDTWLDDVQLVTPVVS